MDWQARVALRRLRIRESHDIEDPEDVATLGVARLVDRFVFGVFA